MFQFLIGRLETVCVAVVHLVMTLFQFLIGRLETRRLCQISGRLPRFNSS